MPTPTTRRDEPQKPAEQQKQGEQCDPGQPRNLGQQRQGEQGQRDQSQQGQQGQRDQNQQRQRDRELVDPNIRQPKAGEEDENPTEDTEHTKTGGDVNRPQGERNRPARPQSGGENDPSRTEREKEARDTRRE